MHNLLALDQATRVSGWAVFKEGKLIDFGHFTVDDEEIGPRLLKIENFIKNKIKEWDIDTLAFEDIQMQASVGNNVQTFKKLAQVQGIIIELAEEEKLDYSIISSNTWKSTLKIKKQGRAAEKKQAQEYVKENYKVSPTQDEADAICIGIHAISSAKKEQGFDWSN